MKVVLEIGAWILVEDDDDAEVRLWHNSTTQETRPYKDIPDEVSEYLSSKKDEAAAESPPPVAANAAPKEAVPFRRERGVADSAGAGAPFQRERGVAAANADNAPVPFKRERGVADSRSGIPGPPAAHQPSFAGERGGYSANGAGGGQLETDFAMGGGRMMMPQRVDSSSLGRLMPQPESFPDLPSPEAPDWLAGAPAREPTLAMLCKGTTMKPKPEESKTSLLQRVTHLQLSDKCLTVLGNIVHKHCPKLKNLYLSDNQLHTMGSLCHNLEVLVLQSNELWEMGTWSNNLPRLESLDLRDNRFSLVEGLSQSFGLRELVLSGQRGPGPLRFQSSTLRAISPGLRSLDIARNGVTDVTPLMFLSRLERLDVSENALGSMKVVAPALNAMRMLTWLRLEGNPLCQTERRYRDDVVSISLQLEELDGKTVSRNEKAYLGQIRQRRGERDGAVHRGRSRGPSAPPQLRGTDSGNGTPSLNNCSSPTGQSSMMTQASPAALRSASQPPRQRSSSAAKRFAGPRRQLTSSGSSSAARLPPLMPSGGGGQQEAVTRPAMPRSHDMIS